MTYALWQTDLSFIFPPRSLSTRLNALGVDEERLMINSEPLMSSILALQPPAVGGLGQWPETNFQLELASTFHWSKNGYILVQKPNMIAHYTNFIIQSTSIELVNFLIAGLFFAIQLSVVFWRISPAYTCISCILIALVIIQTTIEYSAVSVIVKISISLGHNRVYEQKENISLSFSLAELRDSFNFFSSPVYFSPWFIVLSATLAFLLTYMYLSTLYTFGIACSNEFNECIQNIKQKKIFAISSNLGLHSMRHINTFPYFDETLKTSETHQEVGPVFCTSQNIKAISMPIKPFRISLSAIFFLLTSVILRIPIYYDLMNIYWDNGDSLCLTSTILTIANLILGLLIWSFLPIKMRWLFEHHNTKTSSISHVAYNPVTLNCQSYEHDTEASSRDRIRSLHTMNGNVTRNTQMHLESNILFETQENKTASDYYCRNELNQDSLPQRLEEKLSHIICPLTDCITSVQSILPYEKEKCGKYRCPAKTHRQTYSSEFNNYITDSHRVIENPEAEDSLKNSKILQNKALREQVSQVDDNMTHGSTIYTSYNKTPLTTKPYEATVSAYKQTSKTNIADSTKDISMFYVNNDTEYRLCGCNCLKENETRKMHVKCFKNETSSKLKKHELKVSCSEKWQRNDTEEHYSSAYSKGQQNYYFDDKISKRQKTSIKNSLYCGHFKQEPTKQNMEPSLSCDSNSKVNLERFRNASITLYCNRFNAPKSKN
ncbi:unnamed protein product [Heterobilharzia americana]|nr:unnamed protein product [Heterobilharzia americana]CAH8481321.1 unnamed protein product [Heterobilharzia americana]